MLLSTKIESLKPFVNWDRNSWVREVLEYPYDFIKSVEYALRKIGEQCRIMEKTFYLPTVQDKRLYSLSLANLSKENVEFLKLLKLGILRFDGNNEAVTSDLEEQWIEQVETNRVIDVYELSKKLFGSSTFFKSTVKLDSVALGKFDKLTSVISNVIQISTFANATLDYEVINLELSDVGEYNHQKITLLSTPNITLENVPTNWSTNDKVYICNGLPPIIVLVCQVVIKDNYFGEDEALEIPCPAQILSKLDDFCQHYLYNLMITRDEKQANVLGVKMKLGLIKSEDVLIKEIRQILNSSARTPVIVSYDPFKGSTQYGR